MSDNGLLLDVQSLRVRYDTPVGTFTAVDDFSFSMAPGEAVALVGESGCGKSTSALALMRLLPNSARIDGQILFDGQNLAEISEKTMRGFRGHRMGMIFQEPMTSLNPVHRIGDQIIESLQRHLHLSHAAARKRTLELLDLVKLPDPQRKIDEYPHQLSGGQRQRVMIAMAIACEPKLLIADEPTTALDATIQAEILKLLDGLRRQLSMGLLLISHDLTLVSNWTDQVIVMHHGQEMEKLPSRQLFSSGTHPYTKGLIGASIHLDADLHYTRQSLAEIRTSRTPDGDYVFDAVKPTTRTQPAVAKTEPLLKVDNLVVEYNTRRGKFRAVNDASLSIARGESLGLVGESGSGKSTISKAIMRLVDIHSGTVSLEGKDITRMRGAELRTARQRMQMIFQDPYASLNPRHSISTILENILHLHGVNDRQDRRKRAAEALDWVRLPKAALDKYPHEFSGGQRQRIGIARALILKPPLLICDEPVSALDVSVQAQILNLLVELKGALGLSYLFISHDLAVIQYISDRVIVMKDSQIVEEGDYLSIWQNPQHPYTKTLIAAVSKAA